ADDREQLAPLLSERALPCLAEDRELSFAADKLAVGRPVARLVRGDQGEGLNRLRLPLQLQRLERIDLDGVAHELERGAAEQDLARLCGLLETSGDVDDLALFLTPRPRRRAALRAELERLCGHVAAYGAGAHCSESRNRRRFCETHGGGREWPRLGKRPGATSSPDGSS